MAKIDFCQLPFELILKISEYLDFSDIWYLSTCSRQSKILSYQILKQKYDIDLIQPKIINPFGHLIHAAVAYLGRHGMNNNVVESSVLQSVANHLAIAIYDRIPSRTGRTISLDFLLDKTLGILLDHCMHDPTLVVDTITVDKVNYEEIMSTIEQPLPPRLQSPQIQDGDDYIDIYAIKSTGVLMIDFLTILYQTITALFDIELANEIHHRLLLNHLQRLLDGIKAKYQIYHTNLSSFNNETTPTKDNFIINNFKLFIKFTCILIQHTDLITAKDVEDFTSQHIMNFFLTKPSDVTFTNQGEFKIVLRNTNQYLSIVNTVTKDKKPAFYYQWKLWLQETQFRLSILLDLIRAIVHKKHSSSTPLPAPEFKQFSILLKDTVSALTLSQSMNNHEI